MVKTKDDIKNDIMGLLKYNILELHYYFDTLSRGYQFRQDPPFIKYANKIFRDNDLITIDLKATDLKLINSELYNDLKSIYSPSKGLRGEIQWAIYLLSTYSNLSRRDIAHILGVSDTTVVRIKNKRTAKALHIPPLMGGATEEMKAEGYKIFLAIAEIFADEFDPTCKNEIEKKINRDGDNKFNKYFRQP